MVTDLSSRFDDLRKASSEVEMTKILDNLGYTVYTEGNLINLSINGNISVVEHLICKGVTFKCKKIDKRVMNSISDTSNLNLFKLLTKNEMYPYDNALHYMVKNGNSDILKHYMKYSSFNINNVDSEGKSCLHICNNLGVLKVLMKHKYVDINKIDNYNNTPLSCAIQMGCSKEYIIYMLDRHAEYSIRWQHYITNINNIPPPILDILCNRHTKGIEKHVYSILYMRHSIKINDFRHIKRCLGYHIPFVRKKHIVPLLNLGGIETKKLMIEHGIPIPEKTEYVDGFLDAIYCANPQFLSKYVKERNINCIHKSDNKFLIKIKDIIQSCIDDYKIQTRSVDKLRDMDDLVFENILSFLFD